MKAAVLLGLVATCGGLLLPTSLRPAQQAGAPLGRRDLLGSCAAAAAALALPAASCHASGGATAGKTTSIPRAKTRYYGRMAQVLSEYNGLGKAIKSEDKDTIKSAKKKFFADKEDAPASEMKTAGYLLAVAFKLDSKIPPDKIAAVKAWKAMMKDLAKLESGMGGGKASEASKAYAASTVTMEAFLAEVDLPGLSDERYSTPDTACFFKCDPNEGRQIGE